MPDFTLRQIEYFIAVASSGSLAQAALELNVSRSALAAGVDQLEKAVGHRLLHRKKAVGVSLTTAGSGFLDGAITMVNAANDLKLRSAGSSFEGTLRIGASTSLAAVVLPSAVSAIAEMNPNMKVEVVVLPATELFEKMRDGRFELVVAYTGGRDYELTSRHLFTTRQTLLLPEGHRLAERSVVKAQELENEPFILLNNPLASELVYGYFSANNLTPRIRMRTNSIDLCQSMVGRGFGVSFSTNFPRSGKSDDGLRLVECELAPPTPEAGVSVSWPRNRELSGAARALVDQLRNEYDVTDQPSIDNGTDL